MLLTFSTSAATFTVNNPVDDANAHDAAPGNGICADAFGACTLRAALEESNALAGTDTILFSDVFLNATLMLANSEGPLPVITGRVFILGESIDAYNESATLLRDAQPHFFINGSNLSGSSENGLLFSGSAASGSIVSAIGIVGFPGDGILIFDADNLTIDRNYIGAGIGGAALGNNGHGVHVVNGDGHRVGKGRNPGNTSFIGLGNVISSSGKSGIRLETSSDNRLRNNLIGISPTGFGDRGNGEYGVHLTGSNVQAGDVIGNAKAGNFIAGNNLGSVLSIGNNNQFIANTLGIGETGSFINSEGDGIVIIGTNNFVGGNALAGNRIVEHVGSAIRVGTFGGTSANSNFIINNQIGSAGAQFPLLFSGNGAGINVANGSTNAILDNVVINSLGNSAGGLVGNGIVVRGNSNTVSGNRVGFANILATPGIEPNQQGIVAIGDSNIIGSSEKPNVVGGNDGLGIGAFGNNNQVNHNFIGVTEAFGDIGNSSYGVVVQNGIAPIVRNNIIGYNNGAGLLINSVSNAFLIIGNWIGIAPNGDDIGNLSDGIRVQSSNNSDLLRNHVAFNAGSGITSDSSISAIAWFQNYMHSNSGIGIDLNDDGVTANDVGDVDEGPNRLQNFPVIENAVLDQEASPPTLTITYRVDSDPGAATYPMNIDFYWSDVDEPAQGRFFLGTDVGYSTPNAQRIVAFDMSESVTHGWLTATALEQGRNTSELAPRQRFGEADDSLFRDRFEVLACTGRGNC